MAFTKEQLISQARENIGYYADLIERLSEEGDDCKIVLETSRMDLELMQIALASLEAEPVKNGWINCSEQMPEQFKTVLACTKFGEIWTGTYDPHWDFYCDNIIVEGVTHWMPIPELPEESNDKE